MSQAALRIETAQPASEHLWAILTTGSRFDRAASTRILGALAGVVPIERTHLIALEADSPWWRATFSGSRLNIIEQPLDRGTAPGIMLAFLRIFRSDPAAEVLIVTQQASDDLIDGSLRRAAELAGARVRDRFVAGAGNDGSFAVGLASSAALLGLYSEAQPELYQQLIAHVRSEGCDRQTTLDALYPFLPAVDFDRDVLRAQRCRIANVAP